MHDDLARFVIGAALKLDPHPAVALVSAAIAPRYHSVGESEERSVVAALLAEPFHVEFKFAVEHCLQPAARNVSLGVTIDGIAHLHVVSGHALGDRARSAADAEKPAHHFLSRADLGKRAKPPRIKINSERLGMGIGCFLFHGMRRGSVLGVPSPR